MNRELIVYLLGKLAQANDLSPQCQTVRTILLADGDDHNRIRELLRFLDGSEALEDNTVSCLVRGIRGHDGLEGYTLDISFQDEAQFWITLRHRFPSNREICLTAADALFLAEGPTAQALDMFFEAFEMEPEKWTTIGGDVNEAMLNSATHRLRFELQLLRWTVGEGYSNYIEEMAEELRTEYSDNAQVLDEINRILRRDSGV
jgi:hypothetical protein